MGILAADDDGSGVEGVADMADVRRYQTGNILHELVGLNLMQWLADAQSNGAVVVNQSWGFNTINADDLQLYIDAYGSLLTTSGYVQYIITDRLFNAEATDKNSPDYNVV
jgi:hypothetical protein